MVAGLGYIASERTTQKTQLSGVLLPVELLLCNDSEMGGYTRAVSGRRIGKHVPVARQ
jgi:hypothetical protein